MPALFPASRTTHTSPPPPHTQNNPPPLTHPHPPKPQVFMISYMVDRKGYLIVNREVVGADISDFEYSPKPEYEGPFTVINTPDEVSLLRAWFQHMRQASLFVWGWRGG